MFVHERSVFCISEIEYVCFGYDIEVSLTMECKASSESPYICLSCYFCGIFLEHYCLYYWRVETTILNNHAFEYMTLFPSVEHFQSRFLSRS